MAGGVAVALAAVLLLASCGDDVGEEPFVPVVTQPTLSITLPPVTAPPPTVPATSTITQEQWMDILVDSALLDVMVIDPFSQDLEDYWRDVTVRYGLEPARATWSVVGLGSAPITIACTDETGRPAVFGIDSGPLYCSLDDTVYLSSPYLSEYLQGNLHMPQAISEVAVKAAMAHEKGHDMTFHFGWYEEWLKNGTPTSVKPLELAADCLAGKALAGISQRPEFNSTGVVLDDQSIVDLIYDAIISGDFLEENPGHHGTPRERATALVSGLTADADDYAPCMAYMGLVPSTG